VKYPYHVRRIMKVSKQEPGIDRVARHGLERLPYIRAMEFDVLDPLRLRVRPSQVQFRLVDVESDDPSGRRNASSDFQRDVSAAAAGVNADLTVIEFELVEQGRGARLHDVREHAKALSSFDTAADDVMSGRHSSNPSSER
jgi:hypothetical protein